MSTACRRTGVHKLCARVASFRARLLCACARAHACLCLRVCVPVHVSHACTHLEGARDEPCEVEDKCDDQTSRGGVDSIGVLALGTDLVGVL